MNKIFLVIFAAIFLSSCSSIKELKIFSSEDQNILIDKPQKPRPIVMRNIQWHVLTKDRIDEYFKKNDVIIGLSTKDYESLSLNMQDIIRYLRQQKEIIEYYEKRVLKKKNNNVNKNIKK